MRPASIVARSSDAMAPASISVTNGTCFQTKVMMMPRQSSRLVVCERIEDAERDEGVVHEPVLGEEGAHALRRDDERDEQRPAIERSAATRSARASRRASATPAMAIETSAVSSRRDEDDEEREEDVGRIELERLLEMGERQPAVRP